MQSLIACPKCGHRLGDAEGLKGRIIACPACRCRIKVVARGHAEATPADPQLRPPAGPPNEHAREADEPSLWRNPAVYIAFAGIVAILAVFWKVASPPKPQPAPSGASVTSSSEPGEMRGESPPAGQSTVERVHAMRDPATAQQQTGAAESTPEGEGAPRISVKEFLEQRKAKQQTAASEAATSPAASVPEEMPKALTPEALYAMASAAVVQLTILNYKGEEIGQGTGFFVGADGWLVTNHHVIREAKYVRVTRVDGRTLRADSILVWDENADLAILAAEGKGFPCLALAPAEYAPPVGSKVWAIGNPQGLLNSLSEGIVSGLRSEGDVTQVQCTAAVSPGSSGGPLLDAYGRVIGIMTWIRTDAERLSQNLNFAVASDAVRRLLERAASAAPQPVGKVRRSVSIEESLAEARADAESNPGKSWPWLNMGAYLNVLRRWAEARDAYRKALELDPKSAEAFFGLAEAQWGMENYAGVDQSLRQAEAVEPDAVKYKADLGKFYNSTGRYKEAIRVLQEAIRLNPRSVDARFDLIAPLVNLEKFAEALRQCDELERLDPDLGRSLRGWVLECMEE